MALSKATSQVNSDSISSKLNRVHGIPLPTLLNTEEIEQTCYLVKTKALSVDIIHHMLGGHYMDYRCIEVEESFEAFDFLRNKLIGDLQENKWDILFFEDRKGVTSNMIVVVVRKPAKHGVREHCVLKCLIRMTIQLKPTVGFCRLLDLTGELVSLFT